MRITLERLRLWILMAGIVLIVAIASFFAYARYKVRQIGRDLPSKLGLEIQQSTNGFTVSRSHAGHTQFVLHAAKAVQYKNGGHLVLHDVSILMYGKDGSRSDHIAGSQFDYDQATGIARADGAVNIELASPVADANPAAGKDGTRPATNSKADNPVRVKTSGLVFNQKTQVATTDQPVEFQDGAASGSARGATYDSGNGTLELANDVVLHTEMDDGPVMVKAESANFNRGLRQLILIKSLTDYATEHATSDQSTVFFRKDGSADHMTAQGSVHVVTDDGADMRSSDAYAQLDEHSKLKQLRLNGGVLLVVHTKGTHGTEKGSDKSGASNAAEPDSLQTLHADSNAGILDFGADHRLAHAELTKAVSVVDQQVGLPGDPHGSETREMRSAKLDVSFAADPEGHTRAKDALASGEALIIVHTIHGAAPQQSVTLKGDQLYATLLDGHKLSSLRGDGHTYLLQESATGVSQTSSGDNLLVKFAAPGTATVRTVAKAGSSLAKKAGTPGGPSSALLEKQGGSQILSAVQQGHAALAELAPSTAPGAPLVRTTATAETIAYDGVSGKINLAGGLPRIEQGPANAAEGAQPASVLTAAGVVFDRVSGDASATGGVKATYQGAGSEGGKKTASGAASDAIHVIADRASLDHAKDETTFSGVPGTAARLWQGSNSITAPVIVLARTRQLLQAKGAANEVKATFAEKPKKLQVSGDKPAGNAGAPAIMRVTSSALTYSGGERKAAFSGGVTGQDATGTLHAASLDIYLAPESTTGQPAAAKSKPGAMAGPDGQLDHAVATGHVEFQQGERKATGDRLVYTAEDEHFVLTGSAGSMPRVTDPVHGSVTGSSLVFNNRDDSVVVNRGQSATATDTRTPK